MTMLYFNFRTFTSLALYVAGTYKQYSILEYRATTLIAHYSTQAQRQTPHKNDKVPLQDAQLSLISFHILFHKLFVEFRSQWVINKALFELGILPFCTVFEHHIIVPPAKGVKWNNHHNASMYGFAESLCFTWRYYQCGTNIKNLYTPLIKPNLP